MNFKDLLLPLGLALLTTIAFQYFWGPWKQSSENEHQMKSGQHFVAPKSTEVEVHKPLNVEVDFIDEKSYQKPEISTIETPHARYQFSTNGASLEHVEFKRNWGGKEGYLGTIFKPSTLDKEKRSFLVALQNKTPYYYKLVENMEESDRFVLKYEVDTSTGTIKKTFFVYKDMYRIDLELALQPKNSSEEIQARIFFAAPFIAELGKEDTINGIVNDEQNKIKVYQKTEDLLTGYWSKPTLFGAQDRYFVHTLTQDSNSFAQRAYYTVFDLEGLYAIIEGPSIKESAIWHLTFYMGPKVSDEVKKVDQRLEQILNYGWLAPISQPISNILLIILNLLFSYLKNYGLAIIALMILMKLVLLPFTYKGQQSMKKRMEFEKKLKHLQEKYKHDPDGLKEARAELIAKHGIPGLSGCLPLLLQLPMLIALNWVLSNSIELYKAPFLWIPDLSARDPYFILPILTGITMLFYNPSQDPKQKISSLVMAVIFAAITANLSAGLTLSIFISTLLGTIQMALLGK